MNKISLLLVEDNEGDIVLIKEMLEARNYLEKIIIVRDGEDAINYLKNAIILSELPSFILLDINLPKVNGHDILKFIKSSEELKHIPVTIHTTSSSPSDINNGFRNYANTYVTKRVGVEEFSDAIQQIEDFWIKTCKLPLI